MSGARPSSVRCAIYTRKSTDDGLEQSFNTLDAQREACEAYVRSQRGEGWELVADGYDDGGFSGGTLERPAMKRLLTDIDAGRVNVIIVYKVDRLTRSLMDFSRIVDRLDARKASFVSVTQAFNTTTSMGRLTLNVLLSFAQFEREVTGERIRDKIAASKAKGIWMGGNLPLGYDLGERVLLVNEAEAEQVRHIFRRYRELGSAIALMAELKVAGIVSKRWIARSGNERGGQPLSCGALYYILQNRLYRGDIVHRENRHAGTHDAIVDDELFDAVQSMLTQNRRTRRAKQPRSTRCLFVGKIYDVDGEAMTTSFSYGRGGRLYRYYVSGSLDPSGRKFKVGRRIPAGSIETMVLSSLAKLVGSGRTETLLPLIQRIQVNSEAIHCLVDPPALLEPFETLDGCRNRIAIKVPTDVLRVEGSGLLLTIARRPQFRGGKAQNTLGAIGSLDLDRGRQLLRQAHRLLNDHSMSPMRPEDHGYARAPADQRARRLMMLGLASPAMQKGLLARGRLHLLASMNDIPLAWEDQERMASSSS